MDRGTYYVAVTSTGNTEFDPTISDTGFGGLLNVRETVRGFREILDGKHDDLPESAFMMVGTIEEAVEAAAKMAQS